jgi:hypothetical protein
VGRISPVDIEQIMNRLAEATDVQLSEALAGIQEQASAVGADVTEENVTKLEKLGEAKAALLAEQARRVELSARADAARSAFNSTEPETPEVPENGSKGEADTKDEGEPEGDPETDEQPAEGQEEGGVVTASGRAPLGTIGKNKAPATAKSAGTVTTVTTSTGSTNSFGAGVKFSRETLADAMAEKHNSLARSTIQGKQVVARTEFAYPEARRLSSDKSAHLNTKAIEAATSPEAITAAGGLCAPLETRYDIDVLGVTTRPVRDALSRFQVDRGGIQYRMPMDALAMTDGLGVWTIADDTDNDDPEAPSPAKTCAVIECPGVEDAVVYSTYLCLQYPNFTARFDREWVDATTRAAMVAHARFSENQLLTQLFAGSKLLTAASAVSATRDVLVNLDKTVAYYRNRHRLDSMVPLRLILPRWVLDLFRADLTRSLGSAHDPQFLGVADSLISTWFRNRGVNVTFHLDGLAAQDLGAPGASPEDIPAQFYANAAANSPIPPFIDKIDSVLFAEGDWLYLDGGTLDLGVVRDSALNRINRYQTFVESFEGTAFNGIESLRLVMGVQPSGAVVGTLDPAAAADFTD